jgi:predicted HicB family RNase H-like nuclease
MKDDIQSKVENYLNQKYAFLIERQEDGEKPYYSLRVLEFEGCMTTGDTIEEVARDIQDAMREWLQLNIKLGRVIPKPIKSRRYSGKVMLRMPPTLHESLMFRAAEQGVSLNQYLIVSLSRNLGCEEGIDVGVKSTWKVIEGQKVESR